MSYSRERELIIHAELHSQNSNPSIKIKLSLRLRLVKTRRMWDVIYNIFLVTSKEKKELSLENRMEFHIYTFFFSQGKAGEGQRASRKPHTMSYIGREETHFATSIPRRYFHNNSHMSTSTMESGMEIWEKRWVSHLCRQPLLHRAVFSRFHFMGFPK